LSEDPPPSTAPSRAFALLQVLALNGVTLYGVYFLGWSWGTALVLYWCETVLGTFFITLRMLLHRRLTHKRGYYRAQLGIKQNDKPFTASVPPKGNESASLPGVDFADIDQRRHPPAGVRRVPHESLHPQSAHRWILTAPQSFLSVRGNLLHLSPGGGCLKRRPLGEHTLENVQICLFLDERRR
jgi:hypothetical protein